MHFAHSSVLLSITYSENSSRMKGRPDRFNVVMLLVVALMVLGSVSVLLQLPQNHLEPSFVFADSISYLRAAHLLYDHNFLADPIRPFGYPVLLGIPMLFGFSTNESVFNFSVWLNIIFWLSSVVVFYNILKNLLNRSFGFWGTLIFIFSFSQITMIYQALTECLFILLILLFVYYFLQYLNHKSYRALLISLAFLCFSVVVRPIGLYFAIIFLVFCVVMFIRKKHYKSLLLSLIIFMSTIGLQGFNMYREFGTFTLSYIQNYTVDVYLVTKANYLSEGKKGPFAAYYGKEKHYVDSVIVASSIAGDQVSYWTISDNIRKKHISQALKGDRKFLVYSMLYNIYENSRLGGNVIQVTENIKSKSYFEKVKSGVEKITAFQNKLFSFLMLIMLGIQAVYTMVRRKSLPVNFTLIIVLNLITAYFFFTAGISFWQGDRFSIVWYPLFTISALYFIRQFSSKSIVKE